MTRIADLIDIPQQVHQGDFVLKLTQGVSHPAETLRSYVVTPQLEQSFDAALTLIKSSVESGRSKGAYLHGSFGSGKSHFMAVLSLLLDGNAEARSVTELTSVVTKHNRWTEGKRFLVVPFHMIGAVSLESAILGRYADFVRGKHPEAPTPGFYRAEKIFEDARGLRERMGDDAFFRALGGTGDGGGDWGTLEAGWDAYSFEAAIEAPPGSEDRARLVGDLVDSFFGAHRDLAAGRDEGFVSIDEGLVIIARHAKDLGYDAVILFLDELVLWLASHAADPTFVNREGQKVAKLVEAEKMERALPIISFIARQRDLRELVGEHLPGAEQLGFADVLKWWEARFETIRLEDRNLPAIVERRVLRPTSPEAAHRIDESFKATASVRAEVMETLLTREGDREMFRRVYPFSPALVQTLIAVSSLLQRERTALKLLVQLLVDQRETLELGDVVPVGDLYDVIETGDEPFSQAMKALFEQARKLYRSKLVPLLEEQYGVTLEDVVAGRAEATAARAFRNDSRLMKTLILASLADGVEALRALTPARLAALNHGTVRSPIPNQEGAVVLQKVRNWASRVGEIKVADDSRNPIITVQLTGVDTEGIIENAKSSDNQGNRVRMIKRILFEMAGIVDDESSFLPPKQRMLWRGTVRTCDIVFGNVREMSLDRFVPSDDDWRIVVDYPFDEPGHSPKDDLAKVQEFAQRMEPARGIVWIPSFFTPKSLDELGRLVVLDHVLAGARLEEHGAHLSAMDREAARVILTNQRDQLRERVKGFILSAYGISSVARDAVDLTIELDEHIYSLEPGIRLQPTVGATFHDALESILGQALAYQFPAHPHFESEVKPTAAKRVLEYIRRATEAPDGRVPVERSDRADMKRIVEPLKLGAMGEAHFQLGDDWVRDFDQKRAQDGVDTITVERALEWIDRPKRRGLPTYLANLVVLTFALQTNRTFSHHGGPTEPTVDKLHPTLELHEQRLPSPDSWKRAVERAATIFGYASSQHLSATNVARLCDEVSRAAKDRQRAAGQYATLLADRLSALGMAAEDAPRLRTARAASDLVVAIAGAQQENVADVLARAELDVEPAAIATALAQSSELANALDRANWQLLKTGRELPDDLRARESAVIDSVRDALMHDEHAVALATELRKAGEAMLAILEEAASRSRIETPVASPSSKSDDQVGVGLEISQGVETVSLAELDGLVGRIRAAADGDESVSIEITWRVRKSR